MNFAVSSANHAPVVVGLGANLGEPLKQLAFAVEELGGLITGMRLSDVYRTAPVGYLQQPDFYNMILAGRTSLPADELLRRMQEIEHRAGRERTVPNGPRTLDLDLLDYDHVIRSDVELELPHPRLSQRRFVLAPLAQVLPEWRHPLLDRTASDLLHALPAGEDVVRLGPLHTLLDETLRPDRNTE